MELVTSAINFNKSPNKVKKKILSANDCLNNTKKIKVNSSNNKVLTMSPTKTKGSSGPLATLPATSVDCLEGMSAAELTMVRRLAGNDPVARKKTFRKLKKWLNVLAAKVPDAPESRAQIEPNFIRVWKALFYCMWMADKPGPQEQLADSIAELQTIFASKTTPFLLFVEWFVRTMAREWSWIDRFRMDKFMMLSRRFLRQTLFVIAERKWHNDILEGYLKIIAIHVFNRHPPPKSKKHQPASPVTLAPLGLQIHFTDIFMEELSKVGGEAIKFQKTLKILSVFMNELGHSSDDRLLDEIRERIFNYLMQQSDVGMDYAEGILGEDVQYDEEDDEVEEGEGQEEGNENDQEELGEEDQFLEDEAEEGDEGPQSNGVLDPRAGGIDVTLPQLDIDYQKLYQKLVEFGGQKEIKLKNRRVLYSLASQFREITEGKYPLALPQDEPKKPVIPKKQIKKAAKELVEIDLSEGLTGKRRKTKRERKREAKKRLNSSQDSVGSEDNSQYIRDEDLLDHVSDNYMSYLEEGMEGEGEVPAATATDEVEDDVDVHEAEIEEPVQEDKTKGVKGQKRKRKYKTVVEVEADETPSSTNADLQVKQTSANGDAVNADEIKEAKEEVIKVKRPKLGGRRASLGNSIVAPAAQITPLKGKVRRLSELRTPTNAGVLSSPGQRSASKRVSFVLARNKEHEHADYPVSIARSPAIPYDKHKSPATSGRLKSPHNSTPTSTPFRRAAALDFF